MLNLYFVYNGHCRLFLGQYNNVDDLIEDMKDHQWAFSAITHPRFQKHIGKRTTRFDYGAKDCYYLATFFRRRIMAKNILMDLAFENFHKCIGIPDWNESDEVILVSSANKEQIELTESYRSDGKCNYLGKRICIFCGQVKKNNYITLHKSMLEKIIKTMESFKEAEDL